MKGNKKNKIEGWLKKRYKRKKEKPTKKNERRYLKNYSKDLVEKERKSDASITVRKYNLVQKTENK